MRFDRHLRAGGVAAMLLFLVAAIALRGAEDDPSTAKTIVEPPSLDLLQQGCNTVVRQSPTNEPLLDYLKQQRSEMILNTSGPHDVASSGTDLESGGEADQSAANEPLLDYLKQQHSEMIRITSEPYHVAWSGASFDCAPVPTVPLSPHGEHWIHVFVTPAGTNVMRTGKGVYPEGTVILKQKFLDRDGEKTELYTGMRKREKGYNVGAGDWEFFTLDGSGQTLTAGGKIESCMKCHARYSDTDFVSRQYLITDQANAW